MIDSGYPHTLEHGGAHPHTLRDAGPHPLGSRHATPHPPTPGEGQPFSLSKQYRAV